MDILASLIKLVFGSKADKDRKQIEPYIEKIKAVYPSIEALSNDELRARSAGLMKQIADYIADDEARIVELKAKLEKPEISLDEKEKISKEIDDTTKRIDDKIEVKLDEILPEAFAIMKDTARRFAQNETVVVTANDFDRELAATKDFVTIDGDKAIYATHWQAGGNDVKWDMVHYDVQLFGGVVLHKGKIAEMATGEGKTLVATLPVFLNAMARKGVHVVTVNNYLAKRDSEWMGPMYEFHGLSVACIDDTQPNSPARRRAYMADITFGTNNEYGFDYLRDNMASSPKDLVQRKHHYAIVDEVDSVLIDDARTPLIISGPVPKGDDQLFEQYNPAIEHLYNLQRALVTSLLAEARQLISEGKTEEGGVKLYRVHKGLPKYKPLIKYLSETGIKALMQKTENIYMQDNNRRMPEITDDLYFVIDEKLNSVELTDKGHEVLSKYFNEDGFFVLPDIGAEVAELEKSSLSPEEKAQKRDEVINDYSIKSERVHTVIQLLKAYAMFEKDVEYVVMDNKVKIVDEQTGRILDGRRYSDGLHQAIEAKEHVKVEAATQTFATITLQNYFRMYHRDGGFGVLEHLQARRGGHPDQPPRHPRRPPGPRLQDQAREVQRRHRGDCPSGGPGPSGTGRHHVGRDFGAAEPHAQAPRHQAQRAERQAARTGGSGCCRGRSYGPGDHRHQHGRSWYRHQADARGEGRRRSGHHRHGAPRESSRGPSAARSCRTSGRPGFVAVLCLARR